MLDWPVGNRPQVTNVGNLPHKVGTQPGGMQKLEPSAVGPSRRGGSRECLRHTSEMQKIQMRGACGVR